MSTPDVVVVGAGAIGAASVPGRSTAATATLRKLADASLELHERLAGSGLPRPSRVAGS